MASCSFVDLSGFSGATPAPGDGGAAPDGDAASVSPADAGTDSASGDASADLYGATVLADQPVAYYRFEEDALANAAVDVIAGRLAKVVSGTPFGGVGISGRGLSCDGTGAGLDMGDVFDFDGLLPFSVEMWIAPKVTGGEHHLLDKRKETVDPFRGYILYLKDDNAAQFEVWGAQLSAWTDAPLAAGFTHLVLTVTYAGGTGNAKLWVNAQPQMAGGYDNMDPSPNTNEPLRLFSNYTGLADELAFYDKALSAERIDAHHRAGRPR